MTISKIIAEKVWACNGSATSFAGGPYALTTGDIDVYLRTVATGVDTLLTLGVDYTITNLEDNSGATIEYPLSGSPASSDYKIVAQRTLPLTQGSQFLNINSANLEDAHDLDILLMQQIADKVDRSLKMKIGSDLSNVEMPEPEADKILLWNSDGTALINGPLQTEFVGGNYNYVKYYDGDGVTTGFTLPVDPISRANTTVNINGVTQKKNSYIVSGTALTFTEAPQIGTENIEVIIQPPIEISSVPANSVATSDGEDVQAKIDQAAYPTRAAFVTDIAAGKNWAVGDVVVAGALSYQYDGVSAVISDMPGWVPFGWIVPDHFADNTTPGTTDMTDAIQAALAVDQHVRLLAADYYVSDSIVLQSNSAIRGEGEGLTRIVLDASAFDVFVLDGSTERPQNIHISDMTIEHVGSARTSGAFVKGENYPLFCFFTNLRFRNIYTGFEMQGAQKCFFEKCNLNGQHATSFGNAMWHFSTSDWTTGTVWHCTEIYIENCDIYGRRSDGSGIGLNKGINVTDCDGIFIENSHILECNYGLYASPDQATYSWQDVVASIMCTGVYFDKSGEANVYLGGNVGVSGAYRGITMDNCKFMRAQGADGGIVVDTSDLSDLQIAGGRIYGAQVSGVVSTFGKTPSGLRVSGTQFYDNAWSGSGADISWDGTGANIVGTTHFGGHTSGTCIIFGSSSADNLVWDAQTVATDMGTVFSNSGTDNWWNGEEYGSNANGEYVRTIDGQLHCWHSLVSSTVADTTWTYPYAFKSATIPVPSIISSNLGGPVPVMANLSGAPNATTLTFNLWDATPARQALTARLSAIGRWK